MRASNFQTKSTLEDHQQRDVVNNSRTHHLLLASNVHGKIAVKIDCNIHGHKINARSPKKLGKST